MVDSDEKTRAIAAWVKKMSRSDAKGSVVPVTELWSIDVKTNKLDGPNTWTLLGQCASRLFSDDCLIIQKSRIWRQIFLQILGK